ncbi:MAG TPA: cytochrome c-type biogenesis protein [Ktedonobacteraceae bacterium]|nr:cytochrome c-type biogenesis protein [Ktedonobacteraceae bacterium]
MKRWRPLFLALVVVAILAAIWSYVMITTPPQKTLDQKVQDVASQLKCPVCQDESVADSPSLIAQQMRTVIRQKLQSGQSEQQVISYFVSRYGQQILWSPPWQGFSMLAYLIPFGLFTGGCVLLFFILRDWSASGRSADASLSNSKAEDHETDMDDEADLAVLRQQLEEELAADDPIFAPHYTQKQQMEAG